MTRADLRELFAPHSPDWIDLAEDFIHLPPGDVPYGDILEPFLIPIPFAPRALHATARRLHS